MHFPSLRRQLLWVLSLVSYINCDPQVLQYSNLTRSRPSRRRLHRRVKCHLALDGMGHPHHLQRYSHLHRPHTTRDLYAHPSQIQSSTPPAHNGRQPLRCEGGNQIRDPPPKNPACPLQTISDSLPRAHSPRLRPLHQHHLHCPLHLLKRLYLHLRRHVRHQPGSDRPMFPRHHHRSSKLSRLRPPDRLLVPPRSFPRQSGGLQGWPSRDSFPAPRGAATFLPSRRSLRPRVAFLDGLDCTLRRSLYTYLVGPRREHSVRVRYTGYFHQHVPVSDRRLRTLCRERAGGYYGGAVYCGGKHGGGGAADVRESGRGRDIEYHGGFERRDGAGTVCAEGLRREGEELVEVCCEVMKRGRMGCSAK